MPMECGQLLYGKRFSIKLREAVYINYVRLAIPYEIEAWCLERKWDGNLAKDGEFHGESNVWSTAQR